MHSYKTDLFELFFILSKPHNSNEFCFKLVFFFTKKKNPRHHFKVNPPIYISTHPDLTRADSRVGSYMLWLRGLSVTVVAFAQQHHKLHGKREFKSHYNSQHQILAYYTVTYTGHNDFRRILAMSKNIIHRIRKLEGAI